MNSEREKVSDFQKYKTKRVKKNPDYWINYQEEFDLFKIGVLLKQAREEAGLTQEQVAKSLNTNKSAISRIENHASDIRLSTLEKFAQAVGKKLKVAIEG